MDHHINPIVVVPVYKQIEDWTFAESVAMRQCCQVLNKHPIYLVGPRILDWNPIIYYIKTVFHKDVMVAQFDDHYFANIPGYNKLLKSLFFYEYFSSYSHLLLYQLDAFVFRDELEAWCKKNYDYIGAPWLEGFTNNTSTNLIGVGNGGFSLHSIPSAINVLKKVKCFVPILEWTEATALYQKIPVLKWITRYLLLKKLLKVKNQQYVKSLSVNNEIYEDVFWGKYIPATFCDFKVAGVLDAIKFSFEVNPRYLYKLNMEDLPFGCHAWDKYDPDFWRQFIKAH